MLDKEFIGIFVMLNNYFHDLAVAVLFCSVAMAWIVGRQAEKSGASASFRTHVLTQMVKITKISLAWIILGGIVRAIAYQDYEWMSAAGNSQIPALVVKHILLVSMVIAGIYMQLRLRKE